MNKLIAVITAAVAFSLLTAGFTWRFGSYGLMGAGAALVAVLFLLDIKE